MKTAVATLLLAGALLVLHGSAAQTQAPIAFTNVSVVPMDSDRILADHTVIVASGRVSAMGRRRALRCLMAQFASMAAANT
jgi:hypothetical protein